jgi:hypothetical protein
MRVRPWLGLGALVLFIAASFSMSRRAMPGWAIAALAVGTAAWVLLAVREKEPDPLGPLDPPGRRPRLPWLAAALLAATGAWLWTGDELTVRGVLAWAAAVAAWLLAWRSGRKAAMEAGPGPATARRRRAWVWVSLGAVAVLGLFFYFYELSTIPQNPVSDHAEEMEDTLDLLRGKLLVFFPRNLGREPFQFYWVGFFVAVLKMPLHFLTMKTATAVVGFLAIPAMYLAGRELGGEPLGVAAAALTACEKWVVGMARTGLDYPYTVLPTAMAVWALLAYWRRGSRGAALAAGVAIGAGLYGYTPFRVVPALVPLALGLALFDGRRRGRRFELVKDGALIAATSAVVFLPLLKFILVSPRRSEFWARSVSRLADTEMPVTTSRLELLVSNVGHMLQAFQWRGSTTWTVIAYEDPFLDFVAGGLLLAGAVAAAVWGVRRAPRWGFLLASIFVLTLPSTLAFAYPNENPNVNRAGAAAPVIFLLAALPAGYLLRLFAEQASQAARVLGRAAVALLLAACAWRSGVDYFGTFAAAEDRLIQHTMDMAALIREYGRRGVPLHNVYFLSSPMWADARLVAFELDDPRWPEWNNVPPDKPAPRVLDRPLLFLLNHTEEGRVRDIEEAYGRKVEVRRASHTDRDYGYVYVPADGVSGAPR